MSCCSTPDACAAALGNSLQETLESLHYRRERGELPPFARVVIETTGVADPGPIAATLALDSAIARHYRLGSIATVVDAVNGMAHLDRFAEARRQVAMADRIVVSKRDLADAASTASLDVRLSAMNPHAARVVSVAGDAPAEAVFGDAHFGAVEANHEFMMPRRPRYLAEAGHRHDHDPPRGAARLAALRRVVQ
jgi:G3E family GTPase